MAETIPFPAGNYGYLKGGFQYSAAVVADAGFAIERAKLSRPLPIDQGFARIHDHLKGLGRPLTALCACELRSPAVMSEPDFIAFNREYVQPLSAWGLYVDERNPVARCNLVPVVAPPPVASFHAFSYTMPRSPNDGAGDFVTSGAAECPDVPGYREFVVRLGETSPDALTEKLRFAIGDVESRLTRMGLDWRDVAGVNLYTAHDLHHALEAEFGSRGVLAFGLGLHLVRPPVVDLQIEIDARRVSRDVLLPV